MKTHKLSVHEGATYYYDQFNIRLPIKVVSRLKNLLHLKVLSMTVISANIRILIKMILSYTNRLFMRVWYIAVVFVTYQTS